MKLTISQYITHQAGGFNITALSAGNGIGVLVCDLYYALQSIENNRLIIPLDTPKGIGLSSLLLSDPMCNYQCGQSQYRIGFKLELLR